MSEAEAKGHAGPCGPVALVEPYTPDGPQHLVAATDGIQALPASGARWWLQFDSLHPWESKTTWLKENMDKDFTRTPPPPNKDQSLHTASRKNWQKEDSTSKNNMAP